MNRSITLGIAFWLLITAVMVNAAPVLVVAGTLMDAGGNPVEGAFMIRVINETRNLEQTKEITSSGEYTVSFVADSPEQHSVAEAGDIIHISALNANGESVASQTHQLNTDDITAARVIMNMTAQEPAAPIPVLVVSGVVKDAKGNPVGAGVSVQVNNEVRELTATGKTNAAGEYVVTLVAMEGDRIAAEVGDIISVTAQDCQIKHELTAEDSRAAHVSIDVFCDKLRFVSIGDELANPEISLLFEVYEGSELHLKLIASGGKGDQLIFSASNLPDGASVEGDVFAWTPGYDTVTRDEEQKDFDVTLSVTDGIEEASQPIRIKVHHTSNAETVTVSVSAEELAAIPGSTATVEVTVKDAQGQAVTDEIVTLTLSPQVGSLSNVENQGGGIYKATYTAGTELGEVKINASTTNDKQESESLTLIPGPPDEIKLTIEPSGLPANGKATANVTVEVYDAAEHSLQGKNVSLSLSPEIGELDLKEGITDEKGTFTATYTAGGTPGIITLTVEVKGIEPETETITLTEPGEPSPSHSIVDLTSPIKAGETAIIIVTLRDIKNDPVFGCTVLISIDDETIETEPTDAQGQVKVTTKTFQKIGSYPITVRVPEKSPTFKMEETIEVKSAPPYKIEITVPEKTETDTEVVLTMSVYDRYDNPISDEIVKMTTELGTVTSPAESKGEGKYTATFSSGGEEGTAKITASIEGGPSKSAQLMVYNYPRIKEGDINPLIGKIGTTFTITAKANISGDMTFSIGDIPGIQNHPMQEVSVGSYEGTYTVPTGVKIEVADVPVTLSLEDDLGNLAELMLEKHIAIDNVPPPAPENLQVDGGGIYPGNLGEVIVTATATPERTVVLTVKEIDGITIDIPPKDAVKKAGADGQVTWVLDTKNWTDEEVQEYRFEAAEDPDEVGNPGEIAFLEPVIRDIRPQPQLFVDLPSNITYCTNVSFKVTIVFPDNPPESQEANVTLSPPAGPERELDLPMLPDEPGSSRLLGSLNILADSPGKWKYRVFSDNESHPDSERIGSFEVAPGKAELTLEKENDFVKPGQEIHFSGQLLLPCQPTSDELKNQSIKMQMLKPEVGAWEQIKGEFSIDSRGYFEASFTPDTDGIWQFRAVWDGLKDIDGLKLYESAESQSVEVKVLFPSGKVVIAVGGNPSESYWEEKFFKLGKYVCDVFIRCCFPADNIYFLSPAPEKSPTSIPKPKDLPPGSLWPPTHNMISRNALEDAILNWGTTDIGPNENLYIYLLSDNSKDAGFILQSGVHGVDRLYKSDVHEWLRKLNERKVNVVFIMESCYSGEYIQNAPDMTTDANRVFITSADARTPAFIMRTDSFTRRFFNRLYRREDFKSAFEETKKEMGFSPLLNTPQVDATGDGNTNKQEDLNALKNPHGGNWLLSGDADCPGGDPPNITNWSEPLILAKGEHKATIEAFIKGGGVTASAVIFPPSHRDVAEVKSWEELEGITIDLPGDEGTGYRTAYDGFTEHGEYTILIYAENTDGTAIPARTTVTVPSSLLGDVNGDGKVRSNDAFLVLRIAAGLLQPTPEQKLAADTNGDGKIRSNDAFVILRIAAGLGAPALDNPLTPFGKGEVSSHAAKAVKISLSGIESVAGDNVQVQLTVDKPEAIGSADISIAYDPAILTATNVETPQNTLWAVNLNSPGQIQLSTVNLEVSSESVLATIDFKVLQNQKIVLEIPETKVFGFDTLPIAVTKINGEITSPLIAPDRNLLGQNFPNPFNPETWIPFQLAKPADVTIHIYDVHGRKVRSLSLGRQDAGMYVHRDRAAYWDGRNEHGEKVANGVYFYVLKAGQFQAVRRLCVVK